MMSNMFILSVALMMMTLVASSPLQENTYVRYAHTVPQFGRANVTTGPSNILFEAVRAGSASRYKALTPGSLNVTSTFQRGGSASTSGVNSLTGGLSYTVYTYATANPVGLANAIVQDRADPPARSSLVTVSSARVRAANLVNIGFSATVTIQKTLQRDSPAVTLFSNVPYAEVTSYATVSAGVWSMDYTLSPISKRQEDDNNRTSLVTPGGWYTFWMINGGGFLTVDGFSRTQTRTTDYEPKMKRVDTLKERAEEVETEKN